MLDQLLDPASFATLRDAALAPGKERGDRSVVAKAEAWVRDDPSRIQLDASGAASFTVAGRTYGGGRFETPSIAELRARARTRGEGATPAPVRLGVVLGADPMTDIGALQATAGPGSLFQVASQFNCLESTGPHLSNVADYFHDSTQGPRASISAFPGTLVRHYAAPAPDGTRFVQRGERQIDLLAGAVPRSAAEVKSGYLMSSGVKDPAALETALTERFEAIRVGVHDDIQVVLGASWDGPVEGEPRIAQVLTSTFAAGYSDRHAMAKHVEPISRQLLRAAYLGTLLAAVCLEKSTVILTAIGGGVFANPHALIWESILWALDETAPLLARPLEVVLNARVFQIPHKRLLSDLSPRGGVLLEIESGQVRVTGR